MHRNRIWQTLQQELRTQRNRILPITGGDGSSFGFDFTSTTESLLTNQFTFSRQSSDGFGNATFINSQGYVQFATSNQISASENLALAGSWSGTATVTASDVPDPTGGSGGSKVTNTGGSSSVGAGPAVTAGIPHVVRFWIRAGTSTQAQFSYFIGSHQTGTVSIVGGDTTPTVEGTTLFKVTGLTANWTQIQFVLTSPNNGGALYFYPDTASGTVGLYNYIWGVQMNIGTVANPYVKTTGTAYQAPRFEYSPTTRQPLGLLLESTGKNWIRYSEDGGNGAWITYANDGTSDKGPLPGGKSTTTAPDGSTNGNKLIITGTGNNGVYQLLNSSLLYTTKTLTVSVWVWTESGTGSVRINYYHGGNSIGDNEAITTTPRRISRTFKVLSTDPNSNVTISSAGASITLVWWGYQVEEAFVASSYIPTVASAISRNADGLKMTGTAFSNWFKQDEGTILMSFDYQNQNDPASSNYPRVAIFAPSSSPYNNPVISLGYFLSGSTYFVNAKQTGGNIIADLYTTRSYSQNVSMALGLSYSNTTGKTIICANGDAPSTATNAFTYESSGIGQVDFTASLTSGIMHLKFFKFWRDAKPAPELQQIVNNAGSGFSPAIGTVYVTGDMGSLLNYNTFAEGVTYASSSGGVAEDDWFNASPVEAQQAFNFGLRIILTKGNPASMNNNFGVNINDNYLDTSLGMQSVNSGDEIVIGMYANVITGLAGRIEMYKWEDKSTIVSVEFKT
jgi:hypothetical protein